MSEPAERTRRDPDPDAMLEHLGPATDRVIADVAVLSDADVRAPSALPDWSRGHVISHLARNADGLGNLATWARTGVETPMYPSREQRNADIETGSGRTAAQLTDDFVHSSQRLLDALRDMPPVGWTRELRFGAQNRVLAGAWIGLHRFAETEIHHTDLAVGYDTDQWPPELVGPYLPDAITGLDERAGEPLGLVCTDSWARIGSDDPAARVVSGPGHLLLAWVTGRSDGLTLAVEPEGQLPSLGPWR
ncbi:MAG: maleylpyruvate isomerase family mycothiol-dependent enzyme [Nocardioidaceae bacterium]